METVDYSNILMDNIDNIIHAGTSDFENFLIFYLEIEYNHFIKLLKITNNYIKNDLIFELTYDNTNTLFEKACNYITTTFGNYDIIKSYVNFWNTEIMLGYVISVDELSSLVEDFYKFLLNANSRKKIYNQRYNIY